MCKVKLKVKEQNLLVSDNFVRIVGRLRVVKLSRRREAKKLTIDEQNAQQNASIRPIFQRQFHNGSDPLRIFEIVLRTAAVTAVRVENWFCGYFAV